MVKPDLLLKLLLNKVVPEVTVTNSTDWAGLGLDDGLVAIALEITTPAGLLYINPNYNTPATTPDISGTGSFTYDGLPLDDKGKILRGEYKLRAKFYYADTEETFDYEWTQTIDYTAKCVTIDQNADCICATFKSTDKTDYSNSTAVSYVHKINYPAETDEDDIVSALLEYTDDRLANGTYVTEITTTRDWHYGIFDVREQIKGRKSKLVSCKTFCVIKCAFNKLWDKYEACLATDKREADRLFTILQRASVLMAGISFSACGDVDKANTKLNQLITLLGDCGCEECDPSDIWVSGVCGSSGGPGSAYDYVFEVSGGLLTRNVDTTGSTKTVTYGLTLEVLNTAITNRYNVLITPVLEALNASWFAGLDVSGLTGFPTGGSEGDKRQWVLDNIQALLDELLQPPVARADVSSTTMNIAVENLVTLNDFFSSNVTVTITTAPSNGVATVKADGKTLRYVPTTSFVGTDTVGYTITDAHGNTSTAVWTITVNAVPSVSCSAVTGKYTADLYSYGVYLQIAIEDLSAIGANTLTAKSYIIEIRDATNSILHSYSVTGSPTVNPTIFTTPIAIADTWNNVRIQQSITTVSPSGAACGTVTYETPTPYSLNDVSISWFDGTTEPACLGFIVGDSDLIKKNKLMAKICSVSSAVDTLVAEAPGTYTDISGDITIAGGYTSAVLVAREYNDGTIAISFNATYAGAKAYGTAILSDIPESIGNKFFRGFTIDAGLSTPIIADLEIINSLQVIRVGGVGLDAGNTVVEFSVEYKKL